MNSNTRNPDDFDRSLEPESLAQGQENTDLSSKDPMVLLEQLRRSEESIRQRSLQLQVLVESAGDLAVVTDKSKAFADILRRARTLLEAEVSYLSLNDEALGTTSIQAVDGVLTREFGKISMPLGTGLLGTVAASDYPLQTSDYLNDTKLAPYPENNPKVGGEDVRAILGVPIRVAGSTVGALLVADRHIHQFSPRQVDLLQSLAQQVSGFISASQRLSERDRRIAELEEAVIRTSTMVSELHAVTEAEMAFVNILVNRLPVGQFALELQELLGRRVEFLGGLSDIRATTETATADIEDLLSESATTGQSVTSLEPRFKEGLTIHAVVSDMQILGGIAVHGKPNAGLATILTQAAKTLTGLVLLHRSEAERETRDVAELVSYLVHPTTPIDSLWARKRLQRHGIEMGTPLYSVVVKAPLEQSGRLLRELDLLLGGKGVAAIHDDHVCAIASARPDLSKYVAESLNAAGIPAFVGVEGPEPLVERLSMAHDSAKAVCNALISLGRISQGSSRASLGVLGLLLGIEESPLIPRLIKELIGPLLLQDEQRGTSLAETAESFLENDQQLQRTASHLHLHVNTLRQRLGKIDALLGLDWRTPTRSFDVRAAFKVRRLTQELPSA